MSDPQHTIRFGWGCGLLIAFIVLCMAACSVVPPVLAIMKPRCIGASA